MRLSWVYGLIGKTVNDREKDALKAKIKALEGENEQLSADDATKTAIWEVYKFIHINTVAPFGTFRTKIRKWKRVAL